MLATVSRLVQPISVILAGMDLVGKSCVLRTVARGLYPEDIVDLTSPLLRKTDVLRELGDTAHKVVLMDLRPGDGLRSLMSAIITGRINGAKADGVAPGTGGAVGEGCGGSAKKVRDKGSVLP